MFRRFAHEVEATACRTTTTHCGVRPFTDFDGLYGEDFAGLCAGVAYAIEEGIALGIEATNERTVTLRVAAFACAERDARDSTQGVLQRNSAGVLEHLLRDDGDRARGVYQWRGVLL
ncbi:hypothetical protein D3C80_1825730 [compost metagenome]